MREFVVSAAGGGRAADLCVPAESAEQAAAMVRASVRVPNRMMQRGSSSTGGFQMPPVSVLAVKANVPFGFQ